MKAKKASVILAMLISLSWGKNVLSKTTFGQQNSIKIVQPDGSANKTISNVSDYCIPTAGSPSGQYIKNVTIGNINNDSGSRFLLRDSR